MPSVLAAAGATFRVKSGRTYRPRPYADYTAHIEPHHTPWPWTSEGIARALVFEACRWFECNANDLELVRSGTRAVHYLHP